MQSLEGLDFIDRMREISSRMQSRLDKISTEEATKNALVMPFINHILGYHVFDPSEVVPEFTADIGTKKGEKVDYALLQDDAPIMLFECKRYGTRQLCYSSASGMAQTSIMSRCHSSIVTSV